MTSENLPGYFENDGLNDERECILKHKELTDHYIVMKNTMTADANYKSATRLIQKRDENYHTIMNFINKSIAYEPKESFTDVTGMNIDYIVFPWLGRLRETKKSMTENSVYKEIRKTQSIFSWQNQATAKIVRKNNERFVVADKDIEAGEIIGIESSFFTFVCPKLNYVYCSDCMKLCLEAIPCVKCVHVVYCSENCKTNAWEKYHKYECEVLTFLVHVKDEDNDIRKRIRETGLTFVKAILIWAEREGGPRKLRKIMRRGYEQKDQAENDEIIFCAEEKIYKPDFFALFNNISAEPTDSCDKENFERIRFAYNVGNILATKTDFFNLDYDIRQMTPNEILLNSKDVLFVTALILRSFLILPYKHFHIKAFNKDLVDINQVGTGIFQNFKYLSHSCVPNAEFFVTKENELVIYARRNIKKDEKVCIAYNYMEYSRSPAHRRKPFITIHYRFICQCEDCLTDLLSRPKTNNLPKETVTKLRELDYELQANLVNCDREDCLSYLNEIKDILKTSEVSEFHYNRFARYLYVAYVKLFGHRVPWL